MAPKKQFFPWLRSLFTKKLVKTGEGFTVNDETLLVTRRDRNRKKTYNGKSIARCVTRPNTEFLFVGMVVTGDRKTKYRLYHEPSRKMFDVDENLFEIVFKFTGTLPNVRST